ncbi:MAG: glutathione binding-like protein, partial [Lysobacteraceae bacterium]
LEQAVTGKTFLAGDHFTAADLYMTAYLDFYMQFGMLERLPAFETYCAHHRERPAAQAAKARDDRLIAARKQ